MTPCIIALGVYYDGEPRSYRTAATLKTARSWLRAQGFRERVPRWGVAAHFEHEARMEWARVIAAPDVETP
jgi:hypothetical protein